MQLGRGAEGVVEGAIDDGVEPAVQPVERGESPTWKFTDTPALRALSRARSMAATDPSIPVAAYPLAA
ncbi:hypothetical protein TBKG_03637 [Mycobacterium tuberculosis '98-R604 INH-RIF-EM']|nr:hypothetical protein TBKG_03637 [Mycobacterium tuberculosis '98-R604 INH-RIF-EM']